MNQYEIAHIIHQIDGYLWPRPLEDFDPAFDRAKAELVKNLEHHIAQVKAFTAEDWRKHHKAKRVAV